MAHYHLPREFAIKEDKAGCLLHFPTEYTESGNFLAPHEVLHPSQKHPLWSTLVNTLEHILREFATSI